MAATKHTMVALVEDKPGVLNRMVSLFRRRGFNIESIAVGHSEVPHLSRVTVVANGSTAMVEQVRKQLDKLVEIVKVSDITEDKITVRELALIKVKATSDTRGDIIEIADIFRANIIDVASDSLTIEITGDNLTVRELALIKVRATSATRSEIIEIADIFRASIIDVASDSLTIEITGDEDKVDSLLNLLRGFGIREIARTGRIAMVRGGTGAPPVKEKVTRSRTKK